MGNTYESSDTVSYVFEYVVKERTGKEIQENTSLR